MPTKPSIQETMAQLKCCVLVPTYNNDKTLRKVIEGVLVYTQNIIVVNDGSTDSTAQIVKEYGVLEQIHLPQNKGKGNALKVGFKKASELGYDFAITIDSDGQHFPDDIPVFLEALQNEETRNVLYIGARNMSQSDVPGSSSFGNTFSNFWFWFETGTKLTDTQSGYRLYPLKEIGKLKLYTPKFEFEIEVVEPPLGDDQAAPFRVAILAADEHTVFHHIALCIRGPTRQVTTVEQRVPTRGVFQDCERSRCGRAIRVRRVRIL